jgi:hypothetical protein
MENVYFEKKKVLNWKKGNQNIGEYMGYNYVTE